MIQSDSLNKVCIENEYSHHKDFAVWLHSSSDTLWDVIVKKSAKGVKCIVQAFRLTVVRASFEYFIRHSCEPNILPVY